METDEDGCNPRPLRDDDPRRENYLKVRNSRRMVAALLRGRSDYERFARTHQMTVEREIPGCSHRVAGLVADTAGEGHGREG
jgi:hypothetical protein